MDSDTAAAAGTFALPSWANEDVIARFQAFESELTVLFFTFGLRPGAQHALALQGQAHEPLLPHACKAKQTDAKGL